MKNQLQQSSKILHWGPAYFGLTPEKWLVKQSAQVQYNYNTKTAAIQQNFCVIQKFCCIAAVHTSTSFAVQVFYNCWYYSACFLQVVENLYWSVVLQGSSQVQYRAAIQEKILVLRQTALNKNHTLLLFNRPVFPKLLQARPVCKSRLLGIVVAELLQGRRPSYHPKNSSRKSICLVKVKQKLSNLLYLSGSMIV